VYRMIPYEVVESIHEDYVRDGSIASLNFQYSASGFQNNRLKTKVLCLFARNTNELQTIQASLRGKIPSTTHVFIIVATSNRPDNATTLTVSTEDEADFEVFWYKQLLFNISKHTLVPRHELLADDVKESILKTYYLETITQLPTILTTDPVAKWYGMRDGDICRITRENPNVGTTHVYRYVTTPDI